MDPTRSYLRKALIAWEAMRILYSLALPVAIVKLKLVGSHLEPIDWFFLVLFPLFIFNVFYCLGPLAESLLCVLFDFRLGRLRYAVSAASLLALVLCFKYFWPTFGFPFIAILPWLR